ncbi:MAG: extracellular solute-binding protein, partial [Pseudomonadota bacterium]
PGFRTVWNKVSHWERTGERSVRFHFDPPDREAPLILALRPILSKRAFEGRDFAESSLAPLVASGPYVIAEAEAGRSVTFARDPDWWGRDLPFNRGRWNLAEIRHEWFKDEAARFEAFRAGALDVFRDGEPARWAEGYGFPAVQRGDVLRAEIPHGRPSGLTGLVLNTRRPIFADLRVRQALSLGLDFEWINRTLNRGAYARTQSLFGGTPLGVSGPAEGAERALLAPFAEALPQGALDRGPDWPVTDGSGRNRRNLRAAKRLLEAAGWTVQDGVLKDADGRPFAFEILLGGPGWEATASVYARGLEPLGIEAQVRIVDAAQYQARRAAYDFDMIVNAWGVSLSPGVEQRLYWHSSGRETPGTRNYPGVASPAVDAAIDALTLAETAEDLAAAARALDRALTAGVYVIPLWHAPVSRIAHRAELGFPERLPLYGDWIGWLPDVWFRRASP